MDPNAPQEAEWMAEEIYKSSIAELMERGYSEEDAITFYLAMIVTHISGLIKVTLTEEARKFYAEVFKERILDV